MTYELQKIFQSLNSEAIKGQNYKILELMGGKLQHDPKKVIHNF